MLANDASFSGLYLCLHITLPNQLPPSHRNSNLFLLFLQHISINTHAHSPNQARTKKNMLKSLDSFFGISMARIYLESVYVVVVAVVVVVMPFHLNHLVYLVYFSQFTHISMYEYTYSFYWILTNGTFSFFTISLALNDVYNPILTSTDIYFDEITHIHSAFSIAMAKNSLMQTSSTCTLPQT